MAKKQIILEATDVVKRLLSRSKTGKKPRSSGRRTFKKKFNVIEDTRIDPETGGSPKISREIDKGLAGKVETDTAKKGMRNFLKLQETPATRKRAKRTIELEKKVDEGTATSKEKVQLKRTNKEDEAAFIRQTGKGKRQPSKGRKKKKDPVAHMMQTGEILEGFEPTKNQIRMAKRNAEARKIKPKTKDSFTEKEAKTLLGLTKKKTTKTSDKKIASQLGISVDELKKKRMPTKSGWANMTDEQKGEHTRKRLKKMLSKVESKRKKKSGGVVKKAGGGMTRQGLYPAEMARAGTMSQAKRKRYMKKGGKIIEAKEGTGKKTIKPKKIHWDDLSPDEKYDLEFPRDKLGRFKRITYKMTGGQIVSYGYD